MGYEGGRIGVCVGAAPVVSAGICNRKTRRDRYAAIIQTTKGVIREIYAQRSVVLSQQTKRM